MRFLLALSTLVLLSSSTYEPDPPAPPPVEPTSLITATATLDSALFSTFNAHDADRAGTRLFKVGGSIILPEQGSASALIHCHV